MFHIKLLFGFNLRISVYSIISLLVNWFLLDYIIVLSRYHQPIVFILLFTSSVRIYIEHIADSSKPYRYRLLSGSAGSTTSAMLADRLFYLSFVYAVIRIGWNYYIGYVGRSVLWSVVCISCQFQDQIYWHACITPRFGPALELSRSPRPVFFASTTGER